MHLFHDFSVEFCEMCLWSPKTLEGYCKRSLHVSGKVVVSLMHEASFLSKITCKQ